MGSLSENGQKSLLMSQLVLYYNSYQPKVQQDVVEIGSGLLEFPALILPFLSEVIGTLCHASWCYCGVLFWLCPHSLACTCMHVYAWMCAHTHDCMHTHTHTCTHMITYAHTHDCICTRACVHARTHAHTHTHTDQGIADSAPLRHSRIILQIGAFHLLHCAPKTQGFEVLKSVRCYLGRRKSALISSLSHKPMHTHSWKV